jgi:putative PIN family toxin of toxin-antitoxin system
VRVVADSNIYISALLFGGLPLQFLELAASGSVDLFVSQAILDETPAVLCRDKFKRSEAQVGEAEDIIRGLAQLAEPTQRVTAVVADSSDNKIIECAIACKADAIVSGDQHLLRVGQYEGICVMTVHTFLGITRT